MSGSAAPAPLHLYEAIDLISATTVNGVLYGLTLSMFFTCARVLYLGLTKEPQQRKKRLFTLAHMSLVMGCGLVILAIDARTIQLAYIDHADYPGGGLEYNSSVLVTRPFTTAGYVLGVLLDLLIVGLGVWRVWVIWSSSRYAPLIVAVIGMVYLAYIVIDAALVAVTPLSANFRKNQGLWNWLPAMEGLDLCTNLLVTLAILARILAVRRCHKEVLGQSAVTSQYTSVIAMLIESLALDSVWPVTIIIVSAVRHANPQRMVGTRIATFYLLRTGPIVRIVCYILLMYRVVMGRAWDRDTERQLTTLQWNRDQEAGSMDT